jgi:transketolase
MSEENTQATTETVSESPAKEISQEALIEKLKAEQAYSKSQRQKKQDAQNRLAELEKKFTQQEESKLKEKEEFKTLYEKASSQVESLTANAEKWTKYEETRRGKLLESHPEEDRESLSKLNLDTLEYVTSKINNIKPNAPEVIGNARNVIPDKPVDWQNKESLKENWSNIVSQYTKKSKGARK